MTENTFLLFIGFRKVIFLELSLLLQRFNQYNNLLLFSATAFYILHFENWDIERKVSLTVFWRSGESWWSRGCYRCPKHLFKRHMSQRPKQVECMPAKKWRRPIVAIVNKHLFGFPSLLRFVCSSLQKLQIQ